ncbi:unnamed protein product [Rotaria magnacalcarata]|uniref:Fucosyltransferase n=1 Tax=Rotaria magnacalcarata TaxID=392030 RepID=A0A816RG54_9BILA|nr:unnamed protein product [Rotaria magnacalcarata]CAF3918446.1 unnamed protein product [Rotaria magnacalcarata]
MIFLTSFLSWFYSWKNKILIVIIIVILYFCFYPSLLFYYHSLGPSLIFYYKHFNQSLPLILLYTHNRSHKTRNNICRGTRNGGHVVNFERCPKKCQFSCQLQDFKQRSPLAVLFFGEDFYWPFQLTDQDRLSYKQRWIFWSWEAPINHPEYSRSRLTFNWTMTYRQDSDIIHDYGRYIARNLSYTIRDYQAVDFYLSNETNQSTFDVGKEFSARENKILWIVSNCKTRTNRHQIATELNKYFPIDQYGGCSLLNKKAKILSTNEFEQTLFKYKFYLAFENSNCQDYITEKAFYNALAHGSIPIVLGANENNYKNILPPNSFIYIQRYKNMSDLANQLRNISQNLYVFKFYHQWRIHYRLIVWPSNYFIDDLFCNLCIKLYEDEKPKSYNNFSRWLNQCK